MAAKKSSTGSKGAGATAKKGGAKKATAKRGGSIKSETAAKSNTPKATKKAAGAKGTKKAAPSIKLNDRQRDFLGKIHGAGESGYRIGQKAEQRTIDALVERKLVKRGPKDKASGTYSYALTKTGQKHLGSTGGSAAGSTGGASN